MSKLANRGRWLVAAYLVVVVAFDQWRDAALIDWHKLGDIVLELVVLGISFAIVRGVLTWANWAHALLVLLSSVGLIGFVSRLASGGMHQFGRFGAVNLVFVLAMLAWLLLPSVRSEYWNPEHVS
jgi:hypothetical protein